MIRQHPAGGLGDPVRLITALSEVRLLGPLLLALITLSSCSLLGRDQPTPDLGYYTRVYAASRPGEFPAAMLFVSTRGVLAWGTVSAVAELYDAAGMDLREPWQYEADRAVWRGSDGEEWEGDVAGRAFPLPCAPAFRYDEATRWGVTFFDTEAAP
jgi:hypothetical protein